MKWQPLARQVLDNLQTSGQIDKGIYHQIQLEISDNNAAGAFSKTYRALLKRDWIHGWNKVWRGNQLTGWFGSLIVIQPLRVVAAEIERDAEIWREATNILHTFINEEAIDYSNSNESVLPLLCALGIDVRQPTNRKSALRLLQRLNLDKHDQPFIDRWKWSSASGLAYLSDDGRLQVNRDLVWARAIESALFLNSGLLSDQVKEFLRSVDPANMETVLERNSLDAGMQKCFEYLEFYGFAKILSDRIRYNTRPGTFPSISTALWTD